MEKKRVKTFLNVLCTVFCIFSCILMVIHTGIVRNRFDTDLFWHIKIGEDILKQHEIFLANDYTFLQGTTWTQQEWLFDVMVYLVSEAGMAAFYLLHALPLFVFLFFCLKQQNFKYCYITVPLLFAFHSLLLANCMNRPMEFSGYLAVLFTWLYTSERNKRKTPVLFFLSGIFVANFHCGIAVVLAAVCIICTALHAILMAAAKEPLKAVRKRMLRGTFFFLSFTAGLFINPCGPMQVKRMFHVSGLDSTKYINEWAPYHTDSILFAVLAVFCTMASGHAVYSEFKKLKEERARNAIVRTAVTAAFVCLTATSAKSAIIAFYLFAAFGTKHVAEFIKDIAGYMNIKLFPTIKETVYKAAGITDGIKRKQSTLFLNVMLCALLCTASSLTMYRGMDDFMAKSSAHVADMDAVLYLKGEYEKDKDMRTMGAYVTGNLLLYHGVPCFVDTRQMPYATEFGESTAVDDLFAVKDSDDWEHLDALFKKYDFSYAISSPELDISRYMKYRQGSFNAVFTSEDKKTVVYKRCEP